MKISVELLRCTRHKVLALSIGDTRVTPAKCCGSWTVVRRWQIDEQDLTGAIIDARGDGA